jgi:beta-glucanase (GH16 family)
MRRRWRSGLVAPVVAGAVLCALAGGAVMAAGAGSAASASATSLAAPGRPAAPAAAKAPKPAGKLKLDATFKGSKLNSALWGTCYPGDNPAGCTNFGNTEYQWYVPGQVKVGGGVLKLTASRHAITGTGKNGKPEKFYCRSGMVTSYKGFHFKYGTIQVVADVPHLAGLWPALWLAAQDGVWPPEADLIESWGVNHETAAFFHPGPEGNTKYDKGNIPLSLTTGWQTYTLVWTSSKLTWYIGNTKIMTVTKQVPHQQMYFIANVAEYVKPASGNCSGTMEIRSVKVWQG